MNNLSGINVPIWKKLWQKSVYKHQFCTVYEKKFQHPIDKREGVFLTADICDSVQIVAETKENKFLLVQQFRFGSERLSLEFPAGRMEMSEDIIACAERELLEETGYSGHGTKIIGSLYQSPAIQPNKTHIVYIGECEQTAQPNFDEMEELSTLIVSKNQLLSLVKSDAIDSSITLAALAKFLL
ncbi:MAG: NUDIX hydrolase [Puniceicoccales bacterium]|jgi:8-oxo-dGTP pyrophosphatase MutT (NUDIX family)|nr:NUDIX hydrolase [Puniceicoccales bacterium]